MIANRQTHKHIHAHAHTQTRRHADTHTRTHARTHTHTHPFNGPFSGTTGTWVGWYQEGKTNLDFTEARDSEWQWHQLGHMQVCTWLQIDSTSTSPLSFFTGRMPFLPPNEHRRSTEGTSTGPQMKSISTNCCISKISVKYRYVFY